MRDDKVTNSSRGGGKGKAPLFYELNFTNKIMNGPKHGKTVVCSSTFCMLDDSTASPSCEGKMQRMKSFELKIRSSNVRMMMK